MYRRHSLLEFHQSIQQKMVFLQFQIKDKFWERMGERKVFKLEAVLFHINSLVTKSEQ